MVLCVFFHDSLGLAVLHLPATELSLTHVIGDSDSVSHALARTASASSVRASPPSIRSASDVVISTGKIVHRSSTTMTHSSY
jgi:hypothetical protein